MGGGIKRNKSSLPKGNSGVYGGTEDAQPGDELGAYTREQRLEMDQRFVEAMARALRTGQAASSASTSSTTSSSSRAIGASLEPRQQRDG